MRKRIIVEIISGILIFIIGISVGKFSKIHKVNENQKASTTKSQDGSTSKETVSANEDKQIKLNESFEVKTESGDYNFTIKNVTKTDWWEKEYKNNNKTVILLNLECENKSFKKNDKGVILRDAFIAKDNNNYMLSSPSNRYNDENAGYNENTEIPINTKCKISIPYIIDNDATSISIEFKKGGILKDIPIA